MKKLILLICLSLTFSSLATQELRNSIQAIEYAKELANKGLGAFAQNELEKARSTLLNIKDSELSEYQSSIKLRLINEVKELEQSNLETLSTCDYHFKDLSKKIELIKKTQNVIGSWKTKNIVKDKIKIYPDCKMLKIVNEKLLEIGNKA